MQLKVSSSLFALPASYFARVAGLVRAPVHLKLEGINVAGSIKLKPALKMISDLEARGQIKKDTHLLESSSGNLGIALSMVCANKGYRFTCVTDPNASPHAYKAMRAVGADVIVVTDRDDHGGYLNTRINLIKKMCLEDARYIWLNHYASESNWSAHYSTTATELSEAFPRVDWLILGAGTTGTLMGCGRYFKERHPRTRVIAVDAKGSVTFGAAAGKRYIPGLGTSRRPEILDDAYFDEVLYAPEPETIMMCRTLARKGMLTGGSTGSILVGVRQLLNRIKPDDVVVAVSPDMAEKYLDSIYSDDWVRDRFPALVD